MTVTEKIKTSWSQKELHHKFILVVSVFFLSIAAIFSILHTAFFSPDQFYVVAFVIVLITGQTRAFLRDWTPAILLLLSYEYLRGLIPMINKQIHFSLMPMFDKLIFHQVPSVWLQARFFNPAHLQWYDYTAVVLYLMHFVFPLFTGFIFWLNDREFFKEYIIAIVALSYLTFLTYLAFPAAPPWMASQIGLIGPVTQITNTAIAHFLHYTAIPTVYKYFGANLTAAVPSLHAAYPLLVSIYIGKKVPKLVPLLVIYTLGVWLAVIYLGEHYFFDVMLGALYALFTYAAIQRIKNWRAKKALIVANI